MIMEYCFRPRRSMLYVAGSNLHYIESARSLHADSVMLDLCDSVLNEAKIEARNNVVSAIRSGGYGSREVVVRVNEINSVLGEGDIKALANIGADAILFPNIKTAEDVLNAISKLDAEGGSHMPIMVMIESPIAVLNISQILSSSNRICCVVVSTKDLISQHHLSYENHKRSEIVTLLSLIILAARAYGCSVVDGVTSDMQDMQSFEYACRIGRDLGCDGKSVIHPRQIAYINDAYTPKVNEVASARETIMELKKAMESGKGTTMVNDILVQKHNVKYAEYLIKLHESITTLEQEYS
jgi:citrate lyase subunit beta / citryl-CoA lyase